MFERKKLKIETLAEYLVEIREKLDFTLEDVAKKTGIKRKFLEHLESGKFGQLPPDVYVIGFLKQLSSLYSVVPQVLIDQYKKEFSIQKNIESPLKLKKNKLKKSWEKVVITPKRLSIFFGIVFISLTLGYIIWQLVAINKSPKLEIFEPTNSQIIFGSSLNVIGRTDPGISVSVNEQDVFVDSEGAFQIQLGISPGPIELNILAESKFEKTTSVVLNIIGEETKKQTKKYLSLKLEFFKEVELIYEIDGNSKEIDNFNKGDVKVFEAGEKIIISTSNAGAIRAFLNGEDLGSLGREGEILENVSFFAESDTIEEQ